MSAKQERYYLAESLGHNLTVFLSGYTMHGEHPSWDTEAKAIEAATRQLTAPGKTLTVVKVCAIVRAEAIKPTVTVDRQ